jgi:hypothetical protein
VNETREKTIEVVGGRFDGQLTYDHGPVISWINPRDPLDYHFYVMGFKRDERVYFYKTADQCAQILMDQEDV